MAKKTNTTQPTAKPAVKQIVEQEFNYCDIAWLKKAVEEGSDIPKSVINQCIDFVQTTMNTLANTGATTKEVEDLKILRNKLITISKQ